MTFDAAKTLVATPAYDRVDVQYVRGCLTLARAGILPEWMFLPGQADIRLVRNLIAHRFLRTGLEHLVMIDADIEFGLSDWKSLSAQATSVCVSFARRAASQLPVHAGLAFCRIDRTVFEGLKPNVKRFSFENCVDPVYDFFEQGSGIVNGPDDTQWSSEAHCFWSRVRRAGFKTHFATESKLVHYGRFGFKLEDPRRYVI